MGVVVLVVGEEGVAKGCLAAVHGRRVGGGGGGGGGEGEGRHGRGVEPGGGVVLLVELEVGRLLEGLLHLDADVVQPGHLCVVLRMAAA